MKLYSRVHADIDLDAFVSNMEEIFRAVRKETKVVAVIKTDGYGHGAAELAEILEKMDRVLGYAVATAEEAFSLRRHGCRKPILILGYTFPDQYEELVKEDVRPSVFDYHTAELLSKAAAKENRTAKIHIKLDTGMSRIGYQITEESADEIVRISQLPNLSIEGIFTHFAKADETDKTFTEEQVKAYESMQRMLKERGLVIPLHHVSNSAGIMDLPQYNMDLVRAGIIIYGLQPSDEVNQDSLHLKPLLTLKSRVVLVKELEAGRRISYGGTYQLDHREKIATIPVGYGDGYPRALSNKGYVLIHGKKARIRGRICMDQFMVDVTDIPDVHQGDEVTLIGKDGDETITMEELGDLSGRFNYELACDLGKRIPRNYYYKGKLVSQRDCFEE